MVKYSKLIVTFLILLIIISSVCISMAAGVSGGVDPSTLTGKAVTGTDKIQNIGNQVITILTIVGSIASVVILIILGLKYMMGSAEEKAEYKKTMMPYILGAALVFGASVIAGILYGFLSNVTA